MRGLIVKGVGGFYYVKVGEHTYQSKARGIFKKDGTVPYVGDEVRIELIEDGDAMINEILPRKNVFIRPPIANVDCFVIVVAAAHPEPNFEVVDRFWVMAEKNHTEIILCINKIDLVPQEKIDSISGVYKDIYPVVCVSSKTGEGLDQLPKLLEGKKSALAGPSGAGKSTILNNLQSGLSVETGKVSEKTKRGKHTTRHVEIFQMDYGGMIFDTPGFTSFDILEAEEDELQFLYPEMAKRLGSCKFDNCRHIKEPQCAIRNAAEVGEIHLSRYQSYVSQYREINERKKY
jgi:ribosome biogenesis GTPase